MPKKTQRASATSEQDPLTNKYNNQESKLLSLASFTNEIVNSKTRQTVDESQPNELDALSLNSPSNLSLTRKERT